MIPTSVSFGISQWVLHIQIVTLPPLSRLSTNNIYQLVILGSSQTYVPLVWHGWLGGCFSQACTNHPGLNIYSCQFRNAVCARHSGRNITEDAIFIHLIHYFLAKVMEVTPYWEFFVKRCWSLCEMERKGRLLPVCVWGIQRYCDADIWPTNSNVIRLRMAA